MRLLTDTRRAGAAPLSLALIIVLLTLIAIPFVLRGSPSVDQTGARTLIIISPHNEQIRSEFSQGFARWHRERYGEEVKIDFRRPGGTSEIRAQLLAIYASAATKGLINADGSMIEGEHMPYDLCFGGGTYEHGRLKRGVTVKIDGATVDIPISMPVGIESNTLEEWYGENQIGVRNLYDPDRYWLGLALSSFGLLCNVEMLDRYSLETPKSWVDLTDPKFQGALALGDPRQSGSIATTYESILNNYGWDEGWRILRAMSANARYFAAESKKVVLDVSRGDAAVGVAIDFYGRYQAQAVIPPGGDASDSRLRFVEPEGVVLVDPDPISLLRGAPNPELAMRFIEFCLSEEGQALWQLPLQSAESNDSGFGPTQYELRRMPIRRAVYDSLGSYFIDKVNPYEIASDAPALGWRSMIGPMMGAFAIDIHHDLVEAWKALDAARQAGATESEMRELESLFYSMPVHTTPEGESLPFTAANYAVIREEWRDRDRATDLRIDYTQQMRKIYREVEHRAKALAERGPA